MIHDKRKRTHTHTHTHKHTLIRTYTLRPDSLEVIIHGKYVLKFSFQNNFADFS